MSGNGVQSMHMNGSAPVDIEGFRATMAAAGIEEIVEPTLQIYREEARETFDALAASLSRQDLDGVRTAAHTLKSSSGNIHARTLSGMFERIEHCADSGDLEAVVACYGEVLPEFDRVISQLEEVVA